MSNNILLYSDSYKYSHFLQYPPNTKFVNSYIESRGGRWNRTVFFGLQMFLMKYLSNPFTKEDIEEAESYIVPHGEPFDRKGFEYILNKHGGYFPIRIQAVKEGSVIPTGNVLFQTINTDENCWNLSQFMETMFVQNVWFPVSVCTNSFMCKEIIKQFLIETSDNPEQEILFKLHDFGFRGVSSLESAGIGAAAHLVNFMGTDTVAGLIACRKYYDEYMAGFSIPASEHSTITSWGKENEITAFENMINQFGGPGKIYACVSDSYDIYNAVENLWPQLKDKIIEKGGCIVVRPDSGNPVQIVSEITKKLMGKFGYYTNSKGYDVLPDYIRVIQGDGINEQSIRDILQELMFNKISASNVAFGMGGALMQHLDRDTLRFAQKASRGYINDEWIDIYKDPITDTIKRSKRGRLMLTKDSNNKYITIKEDLTKINYLEDVYYNGKILRHQKFDEIRELANAI